MGTPIISKSKFVSGLQCHKLLWYYYNQKESIPPPGASQQVIFDQGHEVGDLAKRLFADGVEVAKGVFDIGPVLEASSAVTSLRKPLFEAAFAYKNGFARADILDPVGRDKWDIVEVKSSTKAKPEHLWDLGFQLFVYEGAGLSIRRCYLLHINNEYVRKGEVAPKRLFKKVDVTKEVRDLVLPDVPKNLRKMQEIIKLEKAPDIAIGPHCASPYDCPLQDLCWGFLPKHSVMSLARVGQKGYDLLTEGIVKIADIPSSVGLSTLQQIQVDAIRSRKPQVNAKGIARFLNDLEYPLVFLDFETFNTAIPMFDKVRPYQHVPFQVSIHVVSREGARPIHHELLADGSDDPRPEILEFLKKRLGGSGSIVAYNAAYEKRILKELCVDFPAYANWSKRIEPLVIDLMKPFRSFHYYHPEQEGSASIKSVLPALTGKGYGGLEIADGGTASLEYLRVTFGDVIRSERQKVRSQLKEYCALDTKGMISIVDRLNQLSIQND